MEIPKIRWNLRGSECEKEVGKAIKNSKKFLLRCDEPT